MKVYISGRITGNPNAEQEFKKAEEFLRSKGYETVNPFNLPHNHSRSWSDYMKEDIAGMMKCDAIYMIAGWRYSEGATLEYVLAKRLKILEIKTIIG